MRLEAFSITNTRCYAEDVVVELAGLTIFFGRNDLGKSAIPEALEIFCNGESVSGIEGARTFITSTEPFRSHASFRTRHPR